MRTLAICVSLVGCTFSTQLGNDMTGEAGVSQDGPPPSDAPLSLDGCTTFSTVVETCMVGAYGPGLTIGANRRYDTDTTC